MSDVQLVPIINDKEQPLESAAASNVHRVKEIDGLKILGFGAGNDSSFVTGTSLPNSH